MSRCYSWPTHQLMDYHQLLLLCQYCLKITFMIAIFYKICDKIYVIIYSPIKNTFILTSRFSMRDFSQNRFLSRVLKNTFFQNFKFFDHVFYFDMDRNWQGLIEKVYEKLRAQLTKIRVWKAVCLIQTIIDE